MNNWEWLQFVFSKDGVIELVLEIKFSEPLLESLLCFVVNDVVSIGKDTLANHLDYPFVGPPDADVAYVRQEHLLALIVVVES